MTHHTDIVHVERSPKWGIQVVVKHGFWSYYERLGKNKVSEPRRKAQMLWVRTRLLERGDESVKDHYIFCCRTRMDETVVTLSHNNDWY